MVDVEMNRAILEELVKNLELAKISLRRETPLIQTIDQPILPLEKKKVSKIKSSIVCWIFFGVIAIVYFGGKYYLRRILNQGSNPLDGASRG
jgi:uncharacterized protein involved in exopolysaccharide biosynthesis